MEVEEYFQGSVICGRENTLEDGWNTTLISPGQMLII